MKICPDCGTDLLDVKRLRLEPGDILVLTPPPDAELSPAALEDLKSWAKTIMLDNRVVLMQGGITLSVLKEAEPKPN